MFTDGETSGLQAEAGAEPAQGGAGAGPAGSAAHAARWADDQGIPPAGPDVWTRHTYGIDNDDVQTHTLQTGEGKFFLFFISNVGR